MMRVTARKQHGFTLIEVLVVLIMTSLITAILMQALSLVLDTRFRIRDALINNEALALQKSILTQPVVGILPDYTDGPDRFVGESTRMRGLTLTPLQGTSGAPTGFGLLIQYNSQSAMSELTYLERGFDPVKLAEWEGNFGSFSYRGQNGDWSRTWPIPGDLIEPTPRTIRLITGLSPSEYVILIMGPRERIGRIQDTPFGAVQ